jgi:hypothetical protein
MLVTEFTRRDITRSSDRLPALGSVMERIRAVTGWTPLFGHWKERLRETLCWESENNFLTPTNGCMNAQYNGPTWSWASIDGRITWPNGGMDDSFKPDFDILEYPNAATSNTIKIFGLNTICVVIMSSHKNKPWNEVSDVPLTASGQYYFVKLPGDPDTQHKFKADVPLEPFNEELTSGKVEHSVRRVPFGGVQGSADAWISLCQCVYLGQSKGYHTALLIGKSAKKEGVWERVGIVSTFPYEAFSIAKREAVTIV